MFARSTSTARPGAPSGCSSTSTAPRPASSRSPTPRSSPRASRSPTPRRAIRNAPGIGAEPQIDQSEERRLYAHYGLGYSEDDSGSGLPDRRAGAARPPAGARSETTASSGAPEATEQPTAERPRGVGRAARSPPWRDRFGSDASDAAADETPAPDATSSWSDAAEPTNDAPPPAEPPSPDELEAREHPGAAGRPSARPTRATDDDPGPTLRSPRRRATDRARRACEPTPAVETPDAPAVLTRSTSPSHADGPTMPRAAAPDRPTASRRRPDPRAVTARSAPPRARAHQRRPPPPQEPSGGPLALVKSRPGGIAIAAVAAAVLFFVIRRLR